MILKIINRSRRNYKSTGHPQDYVVDVNNANAFFPEDKVMLLGLIEQDIDGGCEGANSAIRELFFPSFLRQCLLERVEEGNLTMIRELIVNHSICVPQVVRSDGTTLLHIAAKHGHVNVTCYLLEQGADPNVCNYLERSALHDAARSGEKGAIPWLSELADRGLPNASRRQAGVSTRSPHGFSVLQIARHAETGHCTVREFLDVVWNAPLLDRNVLVDLMLCPNQNG